MSAHPSPSVEDALRRARSLAEDRGLPLGAFLMQVLDAFDARAGGAAARRDGAAPREGRPYESLLDDALPEAAHQLLIDQSARE